MSKTPPIPAVSDETTIEIDLKDPRLAAFLAWLVPGLGHFYQGRIGKGILFFLCIVGTFLYGVYIGGGRVVYASTANVLSREFLERWQYICQLGVGLPSLPAIVQRERARNNKEPLLADWFMRPPRRDPPPGAAAFQTRDKSNNVVRHPDELALWNYELGEYFEIGTVFTVIAGLLNVLAIFDAYGGPLVIPPEEEKDEKKDGNKADSDAERNG
jgi:hypothetical protein